MRKQLDSYKEAIKAHEDDLIRAISHGKWMVAVWSVVDGNVVLQGRATWEFPKVDMIAATDLLKMDCQKEIDETPALAFGSVLPRAKSLDDGPVLSVVGSPELVPADEKLKDISGIEVPVYMPDAVDASGEHR